MRKTIFLLILFGVSLVKSQVITVNPPFPTADEPVTVTLNTVGTALENYVGDVYAHTGITVNGQQWQHVIGTWGDNSTQPKLTNIGTNLYELNITPSIRQFYGATESEDITQLCFVFRSADASLQTYPDIFYDVQESTSLNVIITYPQQNPYIVKLNDTVHIEWYASLADSSCLFLNGEKIFSGTGDYFTYDFTALESGNNTVKVVARNSDGIVADSLDFYARDSVEVADLPGGVVDGINYINDTSLILCLYAPYKDYVFAIGDFSDWKVKDEYYMKITPDSLRYWVRINGLEPGKQYIYQYFIDGEIRVGDIYADQVSDPWNDKYISSTTYPGLPEYPYGKTEGIATVFKTGQQDYQWEVTGFEAPEKEKLVVYELLVRDFIGKHDFQTLKDTLSYLKRLGVNAIELMPVSEFEGNSSWGYNPNYYFAPDKYYGPKNSYKEFIDKCHENGMAVIMDMVLNHAFGTCPLVMMYWDKTNNRPAANNPWFNQECPHPPYCWGFDFNHESPDTKRFVDSVTSYWLTQYKVDGFRFDFTKGFTNNNTGSGYDADRIAILKRMADHIWQVKPGAYVILEHFCDNSEEKELADYGMMIWGNSNYNYNEATMGWLQNSDFSWISYKKRGWSQPNVMGYMESHDEERLMYKNLKYGNASGSYNVKNLSTALKRMELAGNFFFTVPGPKMIWEFGERGFDLSINYPCGDESCRTDPKPPRWEYMQDWRRRNVYNVWKSLIDLKERYDVFSTDNYETDFAGAVKRLGLKSNEMNVVVLGNFDVVAKEGNPKFYSTGKWYEYWTGDSIEVNNVNEKILLQPGEYRLYTDKKIESPGFTGIGEIDDVTVDFTVYPNPLSDILNLEIKNSYGLDNVTVSIISTDGRLYYYSKPDIHKGLNRITINVERIPEGINFIKVSSGNTVSVKKFVKL